MFAQSTAAGYGALRALGCLAGAFADAIPTKGDLDAVIARNKQLRVGGKPLAAFVVALARSDKPAHTKTLLKQLQRAIDAHHTASLRSLRKHRNSAAKRHHQHAKDLKVVALYFATKHQVRALTAARANGLTAAPAPSVNQIARLRAASASHAAIPDDTAHEMAIVAQQAAEQTADDDSDIGCALAGYAGACACGYGDADLNDDADDNDTSDVNEDAQLFLLLPQPAASLVEAASNVYPGAEKALRQGFLSRNSALAAQAFTFLRKERILHAELAAALPVGSAQQQASLRALDAANTLILHWSKRFYDRYLEDQAHAPKGGTLQPQQGPNHPAVVLAHSQASKDEAAQAAAAILKSQPRALEAAAVAMKDPRLVHTLKAQLRDLREELTQEILAEATQYGQALARKEVHVATANKQRLQALLARRQSLIAREMGLTARQARELFGLEQKIVNHVSTRAGLETHLAAARTAPARAHIQQRIGHLDRELGTLRGRRNTLLALVKQGTSDGSVAGFFAGLGAFGLALGGALGAL